MTPTDLNLGGGVQQTFSRGSTVKKIMFPTSGFKILEGLGKNLYKKNSIDSIIIRIAYGIFAKPLYAVLQGFIHAPSETWSHIKKGAVSDK